MRILKWTSLSILLVLVLWFIFGSHSDQKLGENYFYLPPYEALDVGFPYGAVIYKSSQRLAYDDIKIEGDVVSLDYNSRHIIALRKPRETWYENNYIKTDAGTDSLEYYIIIKSTGEVQGPFSQKIFESKRREMNVSNKLEIENITEAEN